MKSADQSAAARATRRNSIHATAPSEKGRGACERRSFDAVGFRVSGVIRARMTVEGLSGRDTRAPRHLVSHTGTIDFSEVEDFR